MVNLNLGFGSCYCCVTCLSCLNLLLMSRFIGFDVLHFQGMP